MKLITILAITAILFANCSNKDSNQAELSMQLDSTKKALQEMSVFAKRTYIRSLMMSEYILRIDSSAKNHLSFLKPLPDECKRYWNDQIICYFASRVENAIGDGFKPAGHIDKMKCYLCLENLADDDMAGIDRRAEACATRVRTCTGDNISN